MQRDERDATSSKDNRRKIAGTRVNSPATFLNTLVAVLTGTLSGDKPAALS